MSRFRSFFLGGLAAACCFSFTGCGPKTGSSASGHLELGVDSWKEFSGERAMADVRKQVEIGPRPSGTEALEKARTHITETLRTAGWEVERQEFDAVPVPGKPSIHYVNLIGRFAGSGGQSPAPKGTQRAIVCSHYDTKRMLGMTFVGANDGASSTGALLELARVLAKDPAFAQQVELVFFDGEEALVEFSTDPIAGPDGLVGSRYYATQLRDQGRAKQFQVAILWDMIGDKDLQLTLPSDTPRELSGSLLQAGDALGLRQHIGFFNNPIMDDHVPLQHIARIPAMDLIDFDYLPWHTSGDTLDQLSPKSLQVIGQLTLWVLSQQLAK